MEKLLFCDKILTSYILCINKVTKEHPDCKHIYKTLSNLELCKEKKEVTKIVVTNGY